MKKLLLILIIAFSSPAMNAQICSEGITSLIFTPIPGTTNLQLTINSSSCQIHHFNGFTSTSDVSGQIINLCFVDTGLLMPSNITSTIVLTGLNTSGSQNFTINAYSYWGAPGGVCTTSNLFTPTTTLTLETPLTLPRTFVLSTTELSLRKTSLFPNPNSGNFTLKLPSDDQEVQVTVTDLSGKKVYTTERYFSGDAINLKGLAKGLYFVKVMHNKATETLKFIVE